jgi:Tol biopolymer transport system component
MGKTVAASQLPAWRGRSWPGSLALLALFLGCVGPAPTVWPPSSSPSPSRSPQPSISSPGASAVVASLPPGIAQAWLAFSKGEQAVSSEIYVARANGSELRQLTHEGFKINPVWSPDGGRILYRADIEIGSPTDLTRDGTWIVDADGGNDHSLTAISGIGSGGVSQPWAPDGAHILMSGAPPGGRPRIWVMRSDGTDARALTPDTYEAQYPAWSPDGSKIAFSAVEDGAFRIYLMNADGSDIRPISDGPYDNWPMWSPEGLQIAFGSRGGIALMNADGSNVHEVVAGQTGGVPGTWAPGELLAFNCSLGGSAIGICARGSDGGVIYLLGGMDAGFPSWKP